jgi:hypothetical protein
MGELEFKGTKGEWTYKLGHKDKLSVISIGNQHTIKLEIANKNLQEEFSNAKLIAAAPEMLEALIELQNDVESWNDLFRSDRIRITNAINKATK